MSERFHMVTVGGEEVRLRIRIGDLLHIHKALGGQPLAQIFQRLLLWDAEVIVTLLQYARRHEEPKFSQADAIALLDRWTEEDVDVEQVSGEIAATLEASGIIRQAREPSSSGKQEPEEDSAEGTAKEEPGKV